MLSLGESGIPRDEPRGAARAAPKSNEVNSLLRGLAVLRCFYGAESSLGNGDIAQRTGLPKSTVSRITATLAAHGYLDVDAARRGYRPGPAVLLLGYAQLTNWNLAQVARPYLKSLANYARAAVAVGAPLDDSIVYVECQRGPGDIVVNMELGSLVPMDLSAIGWAYLHALDAPRREAVLQRLRQRRGSKWPKIQAAIDRAFREIDARGFCIAAGFWKPDISAVGVPLRLKRQGLYLGLNCGAPRSALSTDELVNDLGPRLVQLAKRIVNASQQLD